MVRGLHAATRNRGHDGQGRSQQPARLAVGYRWIVHSDRWIVPGSYLDRVHEGSVGGSTGAAVRSPSRHPLDVAERERDCHTIGDSVADPDCVQHPDRLAHTVRQPDAHLDWHVHAHTHGFYDTDSDTKRLSVGRAFETMAAYGTMCA